MKLIELTINEVSEIVGISESTLYNKFKGCISKLEQYGITYEGKGKKRKFYKIVKDITSNEQIAYETFEQIAYNAWGFNRQTNINKLLHYMAIILKNQTIPDDEGILSNDDISNIINIDIETIRKYRTKLVDNEIIKPKKFSKRVTYATLQNKVFPTFTNELIPNENNKLNKMDQDKKDDNFKYSVKLIVGEPFVQEYQDKVLIDNDIYDSYIRECKTVANTRDVRIKSDREVLKKIIFTNQDSISIDKKSMITAFNTFKKELGYEKLWQVYKTEYTHKIMDDVVLLDIIVKAFRYKFSDNKLNDELKNYNMEYIKMDISELHEIRLKKVIPF